MKILVFSDLHGSLNALKELIKTDDFKYADKRIFLGDVAFGCSRPNECLKLIQQCDCECILGNNDFYITDYIPKSDEKTFNQNKMIQFEWMKKNIGEDGKRILKSWKKEITLKVNDKTLYFSHYAYNPNCDDSIQEKPDIINFDSRFKMFEHIDADYYFLGHEHESNYYHDGNKHFYCVGTLGLKNPGSYVIINCEGNDITIEEKYIKFDIYEEIKLMDEAGYPYDKNKING